MANEILGITTLTGQLMTNLIRGYSAYEIAVQEGFEGTVEEWLASLVGESVVVTVVEDTDSSYILSFTVGDETVTTPNLRQNLNDLKEQIRDMQTQVSHANAEIINLHATDTALDARVTALEEGGGGTDLEPRVEALESSVSSLTSDVSTLTSEVSDLDSRTQALETDNTDIKSRLGSAESLLAELSTKFDTYIDSTDVDLDQLSEIVAYIKAMGFVEIVDELPAPEDADPRKVYILRQPANNEEVSG